MTLLYLERMKIARALMSVNIKNDLRSFVDGRKSVVRVFLTHQPEIGQGFHVQEIGTGEHEKIPEHAIGIPYLGKLAERIKDVIPAATVLLDNRVNVCNKGFKAVFGVELVKLHGREVFLSNQRLMI